MIPSEHRLRKRYNYWILQTGVLVISTSGSYILDDKAASHYLLKPIKVRSIRLNSRLKSNSVQWNWTFSNVIRNACHFYELSLHCRLSRELVTGGKELWRSVFFLIICFLRVLLLNHVSSGQLLIHAYQTRRIISHHFLVRIKEISHGIVCQCRCIG